MACFRLGLLIPSSNSTMEQELSGVCYLHENPNVNVLSGRLTLKNVDKDSLNEMKNQLIPETQKLCDALVDFVIYGCTSGSLIGGKAYSDGIINDMNDVLGKEASITTSQCILNALVFLDAHKVAVYTPYISSINALEKRFLEHNGFEVVSMKGMELKENLKIGNVCPEKVEKFVDSAYNADVVFISCTNLGTFSIIKKLEEKLGVPVFSSNSASLFAVKQFYPEAHIKSDYLGRLFSR